MKVSDIYRVPDFVIALDKLGQALIEKPLDKLDVAAYFWKSPFQAELALHTMTSVSDPFDVEHVHYWAMSGRDCMSS